MDTERAVRLRGPSAVIGGAVLNLAEGIPSDGLPAPIDVVQPKISTVVFRGLILLMRHETHDRLQETDHRQANADTWSSIPEATNALTKTPDREPAK